MKQLLFASLFLSLLCAPGLRAQNGNTLTVVFPGVPTGACSPVSLALDNANGSLYDCLNGAWNLVSGGSGSGTVTSTSCVAHAGCSVANPTTTPAITTTGTAFNVLNYGAVGDGSTNNATALAAVFTASNAVTSGIPTIYFPCQAGKQCQYNFSGSGVSPINPLIASAIVCDYGVTLNYTGSAHAADIGPTGLSAPQNPFPIYRVSGCQWQVTASATDTVQVTAYTQIEFDHNSCTTAVDLASTNWCMDTLGENYWVYVHDNNCTQINSFANCFKALDAGDGNTQGHFLHNYGGCALAHTGGDCTVPTGIGIWSDGIGSEIVGNDFDRETPNIRIGGAYSAGTAVHDNNVETTQDNVPCLEYGDPADGAGTLIWGLDVSHNYCNAHSKSNTALLGPASSGDYLANSVISTNHVVQTTVPLVALNLAQGQTGNVAFANGCGSGPFMTIPCTSIHTMPGGNNIFPEPWTTTDHDNYQDGFNRSNGALGSPWLTYYTTSALTLPTISSDVVVCSSVPCAAIYGLDLPKNQRAGIQFGTVPTSGDNLQVQSRTNNTGTHVDNYNCSYVQGTGIQIYESFGGVATQLGSTYTATTPASGSWLEMESIGSSQTCYLNGVPVISVVNSDVTTGYPAILIGHGTSGTIAAFTAKGLP